MSGPSDHGKRKEKAKGKVLFVTDVPEVKRLINDLLVAWQKEGKILDVELQKAEKVNPRTPGLYSFDFLITCYNSSLDRHKGAEITDLIRDGVVMGILMSMDLKKGDKVRELRSKLCREIEDATGGYSGSGVVVAVHDLYRERAA